ncbi:MAG: chemotaxis protein CheD [Planctomycetes bacterium]|nr:chemotaxis protein CheD [Planctomycetota bacterium]
MVKTKVIVNVSDAKVSRNPSDVVLTHSLGSCIGVCLYDAAARVGGMLHFQLPDSKMNPDRAKENPFMFADSGLKLLIRKLETLGAKRKLLNVKIAGGAAMNTGPKGFDIGKRNCLAIRKLLWKLGMFLDAEEVGGASPRNLYLDISDGTVIMKSNGQDKKL